jgi:cyclophilin family peptidyl-prolyl cis-trans isomerase
MPATVCRENPLISIPKHRPDWFFFSGKIIVRKYTRSKFPMLKVNKMVSLVLIGVTLLAVGCASPSSKPGSSSTPASSASTSKTTTSSSSSSTSSSSPASTSKSSPVASPSPTPASSPTPKRMSWPTPPEMQIDKNKKYFATVDTSLGAFKIELFASETPITVNSLVFLSRQGYYNGIIFHRIIKTFMIQTGDPTGTGSGGPGYAFKDELPVKHQYETGIVAMANAGPNTNGSQFFVCTGDDSKNLNKYPNYTQFGKVVEGMDNVQKIASVQVTSNGREVSQPVNPPFIKSITITEQ